MAEFVDLLRAELLEHWFAAGLATVFIYPLVVVVIGEMAEGVRERSPNMASTLLLLRTYLLPLFVILLILVVILDLSTQTMAVRLLLSLAIFAGVSLLISLMNALVFDGADEGSWRGRFPVLLVDLGRLITVLVAGSFLVALVWGQNLGSLFTALGIGGLVVGLALRDTIGSVIGGISILVDRPFSTSEWIEVDEVVGEVVDIKWRTVRLRTRDEDLVVIPNITFATNQVINHSRPRVRHVERVPLTFSEVHPPGRVIEMVAEAAHATEGVLDDPAPRVLVVGQGDSAINYEAVLTMPSHTEMPSIRSDFMSRIWYSASRAEIDFPTPNRIHFERDDTRFANTRSEDERRICRRALSNFDLGAEPLDKIADQSAVRLFAPGEIIVHQGEDQNSIFMLTRGRARGAVSGEDGDRAVLHVGPGELVGLGGLVAGGGAAMTVSATEEVEAVEVPGIVLRDVVTVNPRFGEGLESLRGARAAAAARATRSL